MLILGILKMLAASSFCVSVSFSSPRFPPPPIRGPHRMQQMTGFRSPPPPALLCSPALWRSPPPSWLAAQDVGISRRRVRVPVCSLFSCSSSSSCAIATLPFLSAFELKGLPFSPFFTSATPSTSFRSKTVCVFYFISFRLAFDVCSILGTFWHSGPNKNIACTIDKYR